MESALVVEAGSDGRSCKRHAFPCPNDRVAQAGLNDEGMWGHPDPLVEKTDQLEWRKLHGQRDLRKRQRPGMVRMNKVHGAQQPRPVDACASTEKAGVATISSEKHAKRLCRKLFCLRPFAASFERLMEP